MLEDASKDRSVSPAHTALSITPPHPKVGLFFHFLLVGPPGFIPGYCNLFQLPASPPLPALDSSDSSLQNPIDAVKYLQCKFIWLFNVAQRLKLSSMRARLFLLGGVNEQIQNGCLAAGRLTLSFHNLCSQS